MRMLESRSRSLEITDSENCAEGEIQVFFRIGHDYKQRRVWVYVVMTVQVDRREFLVGTDAITVLLKMAS